MTLETFPASAAFLSMYFLLLPQKKVPKKRGATSKRLPYAACPHGPASGRLAQAPEAATLRLHPQPHVSSFQLRYCRLTIQLNEQVPALKTAKVNYDVCTFDEAPKAYKTGGYVFLYDSKWAIKCNSGAFYDQNKRDNRWPVINGRSFRGRTGSVVMKVLSCHKRLLAANRLQNRIPGHDAPIPSHAGTGGRISPYY